VYDDGTTSEPIKTLDEVYLSSQLQLICFAALILHAILNDITTSMIMPVLLLACSQFKHLQYYLLNKTDEWHKRDAFRQPVISAKIT